MAVNSLTAEQHAETLALYEKAGRNQCAAAEMLGVSRSTFQHRLRCAKSFTATKPAGTGEAAVTAAIDERVELRDKVRSLSAQIAAFNRETLDDKYVKEKIIGLADSRIDPPTWLAKPTRNKHAPGVPTLFASDWHHGERVFPNQVNGVNEYNMEIAHKRAKRLITSTIDLLTNHMVNPDYPGIVFALGGDMVSGGIHEELMATDEMEIMPVVVDLIGVLIWCIDTLLSTFGRVFVPCVTGNHGRNTHKIRAKGRNFTSFDWLIYQMLAKHYEGNSNVVFSIPDGPDCLYQVYNHRYLLSHGDQFRGGDGLIGHLGPVFRGNHKKSSRNIQIGMEYDTMMIGHFHTLAQLPRIITNGSLKGYDEYAYSNNFSFEVPQQALWITHQQRGITFSMPVQVEDKKRGPGTDWVNWKGGKK
ncbi:MAG: hypothetical protein ACYCZR_00295 [Burkholderiales bacterium]